MSKAFTKDDADESPLLVPARAPLPAGATNYVTPRGLEKLRDELHRLQAEQARAQGDDDVESRRRLAIAGARLAELVERIGSAVVVATGAVPSGAVRFGARVRVRSEAGEEREYRIVGVDEADASQGRLGFVGPLAKALLGRRVGEAFVVRTPGGDEELEIVGIDYE